MNSKHTPGPLKVVMSSTCSAAWPAIVQSCIDPETNEVWDREIGKAETSHLETTEARASEEMPATYDEAPHRFKLDEGGEEAIANATLWAAAPELLEALAEMLNDIEGLIGESTGVAGLHLNGDLVTWGELEDGGRFERLSSMSKARAAIAKATGEPQ